MQILIVEDNLDIGLSLQEYLQGRGHLVELARDGISGLKLSLSRHFDVMVLDIMLPRLDGLELCRRLRTELELSTLIQVMDTLCRP